jgi:hypothetical protein
MARQKMQPHGSTNITWGRFDIPGGHRPYKLHYTEVFATRAEAVRREKFFKSIAGYRWLRDKGII